METHWKIVAVSFTIGLAYLLTIEIPDLDGKASFMQDLQSKQKLEFQECQDYVNEWGNVTPNSCGTYCGCGPDINFLRDCQGPDDDHCRLLLPILDEFGQVAVVPSVIKEPLDENSDVYKYLEAIYNNSLSIYN